VAPTRKNTGAHPQPPATPVSNPEEKLKWSKAHQKATSSSLGTSISTPFVTKSPTVAIPIPAVISQVHTIATLIPTGIAQMANPPTRIQLIVVARYAPLVLPIPLHDFPQGDYLKYLSKFTREGEVTTEEHLIAFYS
jgi:hypothetical protein